MEKGAVEQKRRWCSGLLTWAEKRHFLPFFCVLFLSLPVLNLYSLSDSEIRSLRFVPRDDMCFVGQEVTFTLELPGIDPSLARTDMTDYSAEKVDARFLSARKSEYSSADGERGTSFHFQIAFSSAGKIKLPPLTVYINRRPYVIPFEPITVYEDPATIQPQLFISFENESLRTAKSSAPVELSVGDEILFTLYIRYSNQLLHFSWELPKNSIFTELERFDIARGESQQKGFSPQAFPLARFSWRPLVEGSYDIPSFSVEAVAYNGTRKMISLPRQVILVKAAKAEKEKSVSRTNIFEKAFAAPPEDEENLLSSDEKVISQEKAGGSRTLELLPSKKQRSLAFFAAFIASLLLSGAMHLLHQKRKVILPLILALVCLVCALCSYAANRKTYAVFSGGAVYAVPEDSASSVMQIPAETRVQIVEKAGDWVYIKSDDYAGWVKEKEE